MSIGVKLLLSLSVIAACFGSEEKTTEQNRTAKSRSRTEILQSFFDEKYQLGAPGPKAPCPHCGRSNKSPKQLQDLEKMIRKSFPDFGSDIDEDEQEPYRIIPIGASFDLQVHPTSSKTLFSFELLQEDQKRTPQEQKTFEDLSKSDQFRQPIENLRDIGLDVTKSRVVILESDGTSTKEIIGFSADQHLTENSRPQPSALMFKLVPAENAGTTIDEDIYLHMYKDAKGKVCPNFRLGPIGPKAPCQYCGRSKTTSNP